MEVDDINVNTRPYKVKDVSRTNCKGIVAATLDEVKAKVAEKFGKTDMPNIHLDSDGTEIDDEDYFQTLEPNTELVAVFTGEQWIDPTHYVTITTRRNSADTTDSPDVERVHLKNIVSQLKNNLHNVSVLSEPDLEMITNMDPNSVADITGKDFIEQLKEVSGRFLQEKREALDAIELLKMFAKHKGISIEIATEDDTPNEMQVETANDQFDEHQATSASSNVEEATANTTNADTVIQTQPITPTSQQPSPSADQMLIEQTTPIGMKKSTADI